MSEKKKLNLYEKLIEVRKQVLYLQKDAEGFKYKYATEGALLDKIRPKMDELGIFLEVDMPVLDGQKGMFLKATLRFIWINAENPEERIEKTIILMDSGDIDVKKCGALMTYGVKYFLYKFFNVETGNDPDENQGETQQESEKKSLTDKQISFLNLLAKDKKEVVSNILTYYEIQSFDELKTKKITAEEYNSMVRALKASKKE